MPAISSKNADKNCSNANGSDDLCSCLPGLHEPVIQYRRKRSKSPFDRISSSCRLNMFTYFEFRLNARPYPWKRYRVQKMRKIQRFSWIFEANVFFTYRSLHTSYQQPINDSLHLVKQDSPKLYHRKWTHRDHRSIQPQHPHLPLSYCICNRAQQIDKIEHSAHFQVNHLL